MGWTAGEISRMAQPSQFHILGVIEEWFQAMPKSAHEFPIKSGENWPSLSTKAKVQQFVDGEVKHAEVLTDSLIAHDITLWEWEFFMMERIRVTHILAGLIAAMGVEVWDDDVKQMVAANIIFQLQRLSGFGRAIQRGRLSNNMTVARAMMYPLSGNLAYERIRRRTAEIGGATYERRLMAKKEACADCSIAAEKGWQPIGTLPEIGASRCIVRCLCRFDFR